MKMKEKMKKVGEYIYELPKQEGMLVPGRIFASKEIFDKVGLILNQNSTEKKQDWFFLRALSSLHLRSYLNAKSDFFVPTTYGIFNHVKSI